MKHMYEDFDEEATKLVQAGINPIGFEGLKTAITSDDSRMINFDERPKAVSYTHLIEDFMVIHEDNTERVITRLSHNMLTERILEELYDKKKEWYYVIMDICILQMSYEEAAKHLNIEVQVLRARL